MFSGIKVGDIVIVHTWTICSTYTRHKYRLGKVTKVNKKTFKVNISNKTFTIYGGSVYCGLFSSAIITIRLSCSVVSRS